MRVVEIDVSIAKSSFDCLKKQSKELLKTIETCLNRCLESLRGYFMRITG